ncbi:MAG TPA: hypothetical protein VJW75_04595, partial [Candidatus Eisenbacteria bacterium]|nr:hypothetical protein [Candidatus Eisenbacteria bacterium]
MVALIDTSGAWRATFPAARGAEWSPNGTQLAIIYVNTPRYFGEDGTITYREVSLGVGIFVPASGETRSFPVPTETLSWIDDEGLLLEYRGRRFGFSGVSGKIGSPTQRVEPTIMRGRISSDMWYVHRPGTLKVWSLFGRPHGRSKERDSSEDGPEGVDKDLTERLLSAIGGEPDYVSTESFWLRGQGQEHA